MRPRIQAEEAKFIVEVLEKDKEKYDCLEKELDVILKPLGIKVSKACWFVRNYMSDNARRELDYPNCVKELNKVQVEKEVVLRKLIVYKKLIAKYRQIAEGKKGRGRYSLDADTNNANYAIRHINDKVFLPYLGSHRPAVMLEAAKI